MILVQNSLTVLLLLLGLVLMLAGSVGLIRLPDFYTRTHASSKVDTLGIVVLLAGLAIHEGFNLNAAKLWIGVAFIVLGNPVAVHALARAARRFGLKPWGTKLVRPGRGGGSE